MAWIKVEGIDSTIKSKLNVKGSAQAADEIAEGTMRRVGTDAANKAPVDTGLLQSTMTSEITRSNASPSGVWDLLQGTDYTLIQEYEHASQSAFIRRAVWAEEPRFKSALKERFTKGG